MVVKKYIIILFAVLLVSTLHAQNTNPLKEKLLTKQDSLFIDSLTTVISETEVDTNIVVMPIEELEDYIVSLQDYFFFL